MSYENNAALYSERYGICDYNIIGNKMIYYSNHPAYLKERRRTYKVIVNLDSLKEMNRVLLKRWSKKGCFNRCM